jgi:hypothetical protein
LGVKEKRGQFQFDGLEEEQIEKYKLLIKWKL